MNFEDIIKKSVLTLESFQTVSYYEAFVSLAISFAIGMFIYAIYRKTFRGVVYSYNYNVSFVLITMITTLVIMTISTNIVLSLGMVGALSIVRFRTAVKDPLDVVYMFWALAAGIATGAKVYPIALGGSLLIGLVIVWLSKRKIREEAYLLIIRHTDEATAFLRTEIKKLSGKLKSKNVRKNYTEVTYEIKLVDDNTSFLQSIIEAPGVSDASLVNYTGDYAQ
ncbi:DUF4956 domain-containing protein [Cohnella sp. CIP 111063]|jgi:Uncharacterized membrane protein|uniref:DUF4956 domain-containing protein n=1 Tax=unclassified Cohnella TaxID=2636738 RepID=UPI000B8C3835|nr:MULTISPECIES: DUF4956 domain-containing protein [unclassified Cohnella]OXS52649.1 DUF4956 domain-containing protein [Cohnella sp. CIP 111063]PRX59180.1 uncharacterized protein DUF4956 [Cohnella sp. SGD-V74]